MSVLVKLVLADARLHPARMALASLAVVAAACMVVWVVSGYDALTTQFDTFASESLGRYDLIVLPQAPPRTPGRRPEERHLPTTVLDAIRQDPSVDAADPITQTRVWIRSFSTASVEDMRRTPARDTSGRRRPRPTGGAPTSGTRRGPPRGMRGPPGFRRFTSPTLVGTNAHEPPCPMVRGRWIDPAQTDRPEAAISTGAAERLNVDVGDTVLVDEDDNHTVRLEIIGIVAQTSQPSSSGRRRPSMSGQGPATSALYVPTALVEKITGAPTKISYIGLVLTDAAALAQFRADWSARLARMEPAALVQGPEELRDNLTQGFSASRMRKQAYAATGISLLAAFFIILTTLSMGLSERVRQLGVLRAAALTRSQVAFLVVAEGLVLAVIGWVGGLAAGWGLLWLASRSKPDLFTGGASLGGWCVLLSGACAVGGGLVASIIPAWGAARVRPLEAMAPHPAHHRKRRMLLLVPVGLLLIAVNPLLVFVLPIQEGSRCAVYMALGCTTMALGFLLLAPLAVLIAERLFGPPLARLFRLQTGLVSRLLSGNLWRSVGTTVALTVGLGLFVAMQTWGYSMLKPFVPGEWMPEMMVAFLPQGLPQSDIDAVRHAEGVAPDACLPLAVEQPRLAEDITGSEKRTTVTRQDNVVLIGLDPERAFGGESPFLKLKFVRGDGASAAAHLKEERYCIVPDHFQRETGLGLGKTFALVPPDAPDERVEYTIAGIVSLPGWHWLTKFSGVRLRSGRSAAMVFASYDNVRRDFGLDRARFFWLNTDGSTPPDDVAARMKAIAERSVDQPFEIATFGFPSRDNRGPSSVRVTTAAEVTRRIRSRADGMIWGMSQLPLVTLLVTSLGVTGAVLASVRTRRYDMGVLRASGLTRFALARLVLAEALLLGVVACLLSFAFGVTAGWCGVGISQYVSFFGGMNPSLVVPWARLSAAFGGTLLVCTLAALWPAIRAGRAEPLRLLQAGRATAMG